MKLKNSRIAVVIGKNGEIKNEIEEKLGLSITVKSFAEQDEMEFVIDLYTSKGKLNLVFPNVCIGKDVIIAINGSPLTQLTVGKTGEISIAKNTEMGQILMEAYHKGDTITAIL